MPFKLQGPRRGRMSMTSLIDVIFLLLLFFMLTSTFSKYGEVELMAAGQAQGGADRQMLFVTLAASGLALNGQPVDLGRIADLVRSQPQDGGGHLVLISPDDRVSAQALVDLLATLRQVEKLQTVVLG
ncbi:protein TolR [Phaeobacter sp. CECT 5382]|uniref:ExbD/TolR family protein n=1 Tax=Phaeobacter sp. CECT 5382 TaxID=1712645 RepID=UPI0006D9E070|nr:biopolymer transporter ExbD [Phaeobacter sp. CECT 5382]CUH88910.1 protein TolR [Phaeobacter sp. CECT 5382]